MGCTQVTHLDILNDLIDWERMAARCNSRFYANTRSVGDVRSQKTKVRRDDNSDVVGTALEKSTDPSKKPLSVTVTSSKEPSGPTCYSCRG